LSVNPMNRIFIGYDGREEVAYDVCRFSIVARTQSPCHITPLKHRPLRHLGLFTREWKINHAGQYIDIEDGLPFSTEFSHSRFLVPELCRRENQRGWVLFCDCDFVFLRDVDALFALVDPAYAVMVVKHQYEPLEYTKMDGMEQAKYERKNWSSLMLFNLDHPLNDDLTAKAVNEKPGWWLHQFRWLPDEAIGGLPAEWNFLAGHNKIGDATEFGAIHYTSGGPWMDGHERCPLWHVWQQERERMLYPTLQFTSQAKKVLDAPTTNRKSA
jgi:lipopolysaccharide biosynthesis glycosyltransferase